MALRRNERALRRRFLFVVRHVALPSCCLLAIVGIVTYAPYQEPGPTEPGEKRDNGIPRLPVPPPLRLFEELKRLKRNNNVRKLLIKDDDVATTLNSIVTSYVETNVNPTNVSEAPVVMSGSVRSRNYARTVLSSTGNLTWEKRLPGALIIGVKKGGTRALLEFLRLHPDIRAPGPEIHYFDKYYDKGVNWYRSQMPPSLSDQLTIEKTPSYFVTPEVAGRVKELCPSVKLIVVVRDPVTRAISDYTQAASKHSDLRSFEDMAFLNSSTGLLDTSWTSLKIGIYAKHLERWLNHFNLSQIHFVSGEGLIMDPVSELTKVQSFLGLDTIISDKHFYFNETKGFPCLKKSEGNGNPHCLGKTKGRIHAKIHPETIQRLNDFYRPFNLKFYQMVGQDFGWP